MAATAEDDDFSFPPPPPYFPLTSWGRFAHQKREINCFRTQSHNFEERFDLCLLQELKPKNGTVIHRRSYSYGDYEDERMDVLWEDLNDEFSRNCVKMAEINCDASSPRVRCIDALRLSKSNGRMFSAKKPKILVFIKSLKKVLVHRNSRRSIKKRAW